MSSYAREEEFQYMGLGWSVTWSQCTMHVSLPYERGLQYQVRVIGTCPKVHWAPTIADLIDPIVSINRWDEVLASCIRKHVKSPIQV